MQEMTEGQKAFQANIDAMKQIGRQAEADRARDAKQNTQSHLETMQRRADKAVEAKERKRLDALARRDTHNARLRQQREDRIRSTNGLKMTNLRSATIRHDAAV